MSTWLIPALFALLSFGLWGFFSKLTILYIDSESALLYQSIGMSIIGFFTLTMVHFKPATEWRGALFGLLTGLSLGVGCLLYLIAANKGKTITVVTLTSLYPIITVLLSYIILREGIVLRQAAGIGFALIALYLLA